MNMRNKIATAAFAAALAVGAVACSSEDPEVVEDPVEQELEDELQEEIDQHERIEDEIEEEITD